LSVHHDMDPSHEAIRREATAWFARRRDGTRRSREEEAAFEDWCRQSDAHAQAYAETELAWRRWAQLQASARMREMTAAAMAVTAPERRHAAAGRWRPLLLAASLAVVAVLGGIRLLMPSAPPAVTFATGLGQQRTERLADGTRITLNTQTHLQVRYDRHQRQIVLERGEALFDVTREAGRPFVVVAGDGSVTALGTRFQVRSEPGEATVTLLEGRVEVAAQHSRRQLAPGEQARYGGNASGVRVRQVDPVAAASWTLGRLDFSGLPLAEAVAEANRYSAAKLRLGDPSLAALPVGGSFRIGDNAAIAAALATVFPVRVVSSQEHEIVLMPQ